MRCYFDGSEAVDDTGAKWLTLAGFMASDKFWGDFQRQWDAMLKDRPYPPALYIHMWEMLSHEDPFERVNGWSDDRINQLVIDALDLLQNLNKNQFCSFVCSIDVSAHERLVAEGYKMRTPADLCARLCVAPAFNWYIEEDYRPIECAYVFFDRGEPFMQGFRDSWLESKTPKSRKILTHNFWDLIVDVHEVDMRDHPPIQAADMLAWSRSRALSDRERPYRHLHDIMRAVIPNFSLEIDEQIMREKNQKSD